MIFYIILPSLSSLSRSEIFLNFGKRASFLGNPVFQFSLFHLWGQWRISSTFCLLSSTTTTTPSTSTTSASPLSTSRRSSTTTSRQSSQPSVYLTVSVHFHRKYLAFLSRQEMLKFCFSIEIINK